MLKKVMIYGKTASYFFFFKFYEFERVCFSDVLLNP